MPGESMLPISPPPGLLFKESVNRTFLSIKFYNGNFALGSPRVCNGHSDDIKRIG